MASGRPGETERRRTLNIRRLSYVKNRKTGLSVTVQKPDAEHRLRFSEHYFPVS